MKYRDYFSNRMYGKKNENAIDIGPNLAQSMHYAPTSDRWIIYFELSIRCCRVDWKRGNVF